MTRGQAGRRRRRFAVEIALPTLGALLLALPAAATAATQIGETFTPDTPDSNDTFLQSGSPGGQYAAPFSGVITSWSFQAGPDPPELNFKAARHAGGDNFTIVGESGLETGIIANALNTFPTRIPVQAGDVIGFFVGNAGEVGRTGITGYTVGNDDDDLDQSVGRADLYAPVEGHQLDLSAMLEPDCDGDQFGDETQDSEVPFGGPCPRGDRTVTLDANKNKVKKGKRVTLTGQLNQVTRQGACESGQPVQLQRKKPSQTTFTTVEQLQTSATGSFSTRRKVKKTFEYRAQVAETGACLGQTSNTEKVKVKKKK